MPMRVRSGRSGRRRGSQNPGTLTGKAATVTGAAAGAAGGACAKAPPISASAPTPSTPEARVTTKKNAGRTRAPNIRSDRSKQSEMAAQVGGEFVRFPPEIERCHEVPGLIPQINDGRVIHGVVAAFQRHFLGVNEVALQGRGDRRRIAGQTAQARIEARQIVLEYLRRVALRIDAYEQRADPAGVGAEPVEHFRHLEQRRRTHVGTMGEAEEDEEGMSEQVPIGGGLAVLIDQLERAADGRLEWTG